ncbi:MAG TPA: malate synthase A [Thermoanaerobaculia bacterium]
MRSDIEVKGRAVPGQEAVLTDEALDLVADLERQFGGGREDLLLRRAIRQADLDRGGSYEPPTDTRHVREGDWRLPPPPRDLEDRRVELSAPATDRRKIVNALNSGAQTYLADLEDSVAPNWTNHVVSQIHLRQAVRREIDEVSESGKEYRLHERTAVLTVRTRGLHLVEPGLRVGGEPVSAALFDAALFVFHNAHELAARGSGPYLALTKLEGRHEADWWARVLGATEDALGLPRGTVRVTVQLETLPAAFAMDEMLYALREHAVAMSIGRFDYTWSVLRKLKASAPILPDRSRLSAAVPFLAAHSALVVHTAHRRGANAIGGAGSLLPSRRDAEQNERALAIARREVEGEVESGFDGVSIIHPDFVAVAARVFAAHLEGRVDQKDWMGAEVEPRELLHFGNGASPLTPEGVRETVHSALLYLDVWLRGEGAVAVANRMVDAATAELGRAQLWHWAQKGAELEDGRRFTLPLFRELLAEEVAALGGADEGSLGQAAERLTRMVEAREPEEFFTLTT